MASQIIFLEKNKIDIENVNSEITVTDAVAVGTGQTFTTMMTDRKNYTAWMTTGSTDAALTQLDVAMGDPFVISDIILLGHNLKNYTIQYKNGVSSYQDFSTVINPTADTKKHTAYNFSEVTATDIRIIINGCQAVDADKIIRQLIITKQIGQLEGWPQIQAPKISNQKRKIKMLSGKIRIVEGLESFSCKLQVRAWRIQADIDILETIYFKRAGVLLWVNADDDDQFFLDLKGYRKDDIFLVRPIDDWSPELLTGVYINPIKVTMSLAEVIS